jgi:SAM-dependent methyltransferase
MDSMSEKLVMFASQELLKKEGVSSETYKLIYQGKPPWEIGKPQPIIVEIEKNHGFISPILDIGCGYGENAKFLAVKGHKVCAIDYLPEVISLAKDRYKHHNLSFRVNNALQLDGFVSKFKTLIDSATFHGFSDTQREEYVKQLHQYMCVDSCIYLIGFSIHETRQGGPRRLSKEIIEFYFNNGWEIEFIQNTLYMTTIFSDGARALLAKIRRI